ncbi:unnamed protein product [Lepidochelys kempii]
MPGVPDKTYRYQACRFGAVQDQAEELRLYTVQVPHKRERRPPPCYLTKWDGKSFLPLLTQPCGGEVISCLSISDSGTFLGLGTVTGSVAIHVSFSLQRLYYVKEAHGIVVTAVAFLPESRRGRELLVENEAALLSVAVDSRCKLHLLPPRRSFPVWPAAAALCWPGGGHHPAAAAGLPRLPVAVRSPAGGGLGSGLALGDSNRLPCLGHAGTSPQGCGILACLVLPAPPQDNVKQLGDLQPLGPTPGAPAQSLACPAHPRWSQGAQATGELPVAGRVLPASPWAELSVTVRCSGWARLAQLWHGAESWLWGGGQSPACASRPHDAHPAVCQQGQPALLQLAGCH